MYSSSMLFVYAWSSIYYKFYSIPLSSQVRAVDRFPLWIIEKRPFPAMTCRWTLEMEMKALLVSERIAQSSPRFLSSIRAARIIAASSMMFAMFELFSNYFPLVMGHDLDNAIYDRISLFFDSTSSLQIWSRKRGEGCV